MKLPSKLVLPITTIVVAAAITISTIFYMTASHEAEIEELTIQNNDLFVDLVIANKELNEYLLIEEDLISLGASHTQAVAVIKASKAYNLDPKH